MSSVVLTTSDGNVTHYTYDGNNNLLTENVYNAAGALVSSTAYTYDYFGDQTSVSLGGGISVTQTNYCNNGGNTTGLQTPSTTPPAVPTVPPSAGASAPSTPIRFGNNANQTSHTFRHVVAVGMGQGAVQAAVQADVAANLGAINAGLNVRTITVGGQQLTYHAFKLPDGVINVGRITLP